MRGAPHVRSGANGQRLTEPQARQILEQLAAGQANAFNVLDPIAGNPPDPITAFNAQVGVPANADPFAQGREYGIIVENGTKEAHIVVGTSGSVDWADLTAQGSAVAHLHPLVEMKEAVPGKYNRPDSPARWSRRWARPTGNATGYSLQEVASNPGLFYFLLPTIGDIGFCARNKIVNHTVYTPYRYHNHEIVDPQTQPGAPLLSFVLKDSAGDDRNGYTATVETWAGGNMLVSHTATVSNEYIDKPRQTIYKVV